MVRTVTEDFNVANTTVTGISGANVKDVSKQLDIECNKVKYDNVIFVVGGNDCDSPQEEDNIIQDFNDLICKGKAKCENVVVSSIFPRKSGPQIQNKIDSVNSKLSKACAEKSCKYVNQDGTFKLYDGTRNDSLYKDNVHLNKKGKDKMLSNLGLIYQERTYAQVVSNNSRNTKTIGNAYPRSGTVTDNTYHRLGNETYPHRRPDNKNNQPTCHFCGVPGHMKNQCRFW